MKDSVARQSIEELTKQVNCKLKNLCFKECPKCKRETLTSKSPQELSAYPALLVSHMGMVHPEGFECLICGTEYEMKETAKIIK